MSRKKEREKRERKREKVMPLRMATTFDIARTPLGPIYGHVNGRPIGWSIPKVSHTEYLQSSSTDLGDAHNYSGMKYKSVTACIGQLHSHTDRHKKYSN